MMTAPEITIMLAVHSSVGRHMAKAAVASKPGFVALVGPVNSGKSSTLAGISFEGAEVMHGFASSVRVTIRQGSAENPDGNLFQGSTLDDARGRAMRGERWNQASTDTGKVWQYPIIFGVDAGGRMLTRDFSVLDSGGGLLLPQSDRDGPSPPPAGTGDYEGIYDENRKKLKAFIQERADGIVFCLDLVENDASQWQRAFEELADELLTPIAKGQPPRRIAVVFTKTDQLFAFDGAMAARRALDRQTMIERLGIVLHGSNKKVLETWQRLERERADQVSIRCFATSTFGYIRGNGCANTSWSGRGEIKHWLIGDDDLTGAASHGSSASSGPISRPPTARPGTRRGDSNVDFLRPMMVLDPFIFAAIGDQLPTGETLVSRGSFRISELITPPAVVAAANTAKRPRNLLGKFLTLE